MRRTLAVLLALFAFHRSIARAVEVRSELTAGREFVFLTNDVEVELLDGQLALGGGLTLVGDYAIERYGAQALVEWRGEHASAGVAATFGPRQAGRGWASLDPHAEVERTVGRWRLRADAGVLLRRIDAALRRRPIAVDQLQLHAAGDVTLDDRWRLGLFALYSFYDPEPSAPSLQGLDLGLAVTLAGRPERWAAGASVARRAHRAVWCELGAAGVVYADGQGAAMVPRAVLRLGPWRGVSVAAALDLVVGAAGATAEPLRAIGGLELGYER
ncbi:MAG TPA: hypothetical protein VF334_15945 [Polyangia bacterium]